MQQHLAGNFLWSVKCSYIVLGIFGLSCIHLIQRHERSASGHLTSVHDLEDICGYLIRVHNQMKHSKTRKKRHWISALNNSYSKWASVAQFSVQASFTSELRLCKRLSPLSCGFASVFHLWVAALQASFTSELRLCKRLSPLSCGFASVFHLWVAALQASFTSELRLCKRLSPLSLRLWVSHSPRKSWVFSGCSGFLPRGKVDRVG